MFDKIRCQSCGMPLGEGFWGTKANHEIEPEFCKFCYVGGQFLEPNLSCEIMIERSVYYMATQLKMPISEAKKIALEVIPQLKRWQ